MGARTVRMPTETTSFTDLPPCQWYADSGTRADVDEETVIASRPRPADARPRSRSRKSEAENATVPAGATDA